MKKLYTMVDNDTSELFIALCNAMEESIYGRLRKLINIDLETNHDIVEEAIKDPEVKVDMEKYIDFWSFLELWATHKSNDNTARA